MGRGRFKYFEPPVIMDGYTPPATPVGIEDIKFFKYEPPIFDDPTAPTDVDVGKAKKRLSITSDYAISSEDHFIGVDTTGAAVTVTLPARASIEEGKIYIIKDEGGFSATNAIKVQCADGARIDNLAAVTLSSNYCAISIYFNASDWHIY